MFFKINTFGEEAMNNKIIRIVKQWEAMKNREIKKKENLVEENLKEKILEENKTESLNIKTRSIR